MEDSEMSVVGGIAFDTVYLWRANASHVPLTFRLNNFSRYFSFYPQDPAFFAASSAINSQVTIFENSVPKSPAKCLDADKHYNERTPANSISWMSTGYLLVAYDKKIIFWKNELPVIYHSSFPQ